MRGIVEMPCDGVDVIRVMCVHDLGMSREESYRFADTEEDALITLMAWVDEICIEHPDAIPDLGDGLMLITLEDGSVMQLWLQGDFYEDLF